MKLTIDIPDARIAAALDEAGRAVRYWAADAERPHIMVLRLRVQGGMGEESGKWYRVGVRRALQCLAVHHPEWLADLANGYLDDTGRDAFIQYGCFGKLVFG